jgi:uncharacterized protein
VHQGANSVNAHLDEASRNPSAMPEIDAAHSRYPLEIRASPIHRFGVFTREAISPHERVIEYTGELISYRQAAQRSERARLYLFWLSPGLVVDGAVGGSGAEFINHSCQPNLVPQIEGGRIFFESLRRVSVGEELLIDYKIRGHSERISCMCGNKLCRGVLNVD